MSGVVSVLFPVFALIGIGYVASLRNWLGPMATSVLNRYVIRLALPAELFHITVGLPLADLKHGGFAAAFTLGIVVTFALGWVWDSGRPPMGTHRLSGAAIDGLAASYANTAFMGIPICLAVFGSQASAALTLSNLITVCLLMAGVILLIEFEQQDTSTSRGRLPLIGKIFGGVLLNPLVSAPLVGLAVNCVHFPVFKGIEHMIEMLGDSASPCALVTIGIFLAETRRDPAPASAVARLCFLKMVVQPAMTVAGAIYLFGLQGRWLEEALLLSAMPTGTGPFMLAKLYDREAAIASRVTLLTTIISVLTVSVIIAAIGARSPLKS